MMVQKKILHFLVTATFVFANVVCPCASAASSSANVSKASQHQHHQMSHPAEQPSDITPANSDCQHQQCKNCESDSAISADRDVLVSPSSNLVTISLEDDDAALDVALEHQHEWALASRSTGPPIALLASVATSPVNLHDLQLE